jgi:hypothetical protein
MTTCILSTKTQRVKTTIAETEIFFESNASPQLSPEAIDLLNLIPSLALDRTIEITSSDHTFRRNINKAVRILAKWHFQAREPKLSASNLSHPISSARQTAFKKTATYFSGGADSFHTLLQHQHEIDSLIFVEGFDISLDNHRVAEKAAKSIQEIAESLGKTAIIIRTNIRQLLDQYVGWGHCGHGIAMAVVAHLLSDHISTVYIPSSYHHNQLFPWGSHPDLDPLWSSNSLQIIHDGCDAYREEKFAYIAKHSIALKHLRICFDEKSGQFNCNRCRKCLNAKLHLLEHGKLEQSATFSHEIRARDLLKADMYNILSSKHNLRRLWASPQTRKLALAMGLSYYRGKLTHDSISVLRKLKTNIIRQQG